MTWRARRSRALVALALAAGLAACTTSATDVAAALTTRVRTQGIPARSSRCDRSGRVAKGQRLQCTADVAGVPVPYEVIMTSARSFQARPTVAVIAKADLEARLVEQTRDSTGLSAVVRCGPAPVQTSATLGQAGCTAMFDATTVPLVVTVADGNRFTSAFGQPVLIADQAEHSLAQQLAADTGRTAIIDCGAAAVVVVPAGGTAPCTYRLDDGRSGTLAVAVDSVGLPSIASGP